MSNNEISQLSIRELFKASNYVIPIYQRNYSWGEAQISQLIQDIIDSEVNSESESYYLGTLIIYPREKDNTIIYETIDGQQRLTTLSLLVAAIKNWPKDELEIELAIQLESLSLSETKVNLSFDSREISKKTLDAAFEDNFRPFENYNSNIKNGYELVVRNLKQKLTAHDLNIKDFASHLLEKVKIFRVAVPEDTNLNHYFEIMNSRGEQLEKHEILKATLMSKLAEDPMSKKVFHLIWEACSNMEKYVQYGFSTTLRAKIFGSDWNSFELNDFSEIVYAAKECATTGNESSTKIPLSDIINGKTQSSRPSEQNNDENPDRFSSVINFPNFLLQVLKVKAQGKGNVSLDDKQLIVKFENRLKTAEDVKEFMYDLLLMRFLFDQYVIKRDHNENKWSLSHLKSNGSYPNTFSNQKDESEAEIKSHSKLLQLLSMFHVSNPSFTYKHWLNAALFHLYKEKDSYKKNTEDAAAQPSNYINYLENLAKSFLFDRFLAVQPKEFSDIIYPQEDHPENSSKKLLDWEKLSFDRQAHSFPFNYLDYLLWLQNEEKDEKDKEIRKFVFSSRSSIEHYYPQHPINGSDTLDQDTLHSFGNLCLISRSKNSRLSNYLPDAKKQQYHKKDAIDSIKQYIMMEQTSQDKPWNKNAIEKHGEEMIALFKQQLSKSN